MGALAFLFALCIQQLATAAEWVSNAPDAPSSAYSHELAMMLWWHSRTVYCPAKEIANMTCATCHYWSQEGRRLTDVTPFTNASRQSQAYVAVDRSDGLVAPRVMVVHRGSRNNRNWITNLKYWQSDYPGCELMAAGLPNRDELFGDCKAHTGFMNEWRGFVHGGLLLHVGDTVARLRKERGGAPVDVLVTGHSLGGAIALHAALAISHSVAGANVKLYSFGAPRVGNAAFARFAAWKLKAGQQAFRVTHGADPVTRLPMQSTFMTSYRHVPHEIHYNQDDPEPHRFIECKDIGERKPSQPTSWWLGGLPVAGWFTTSAGGPAEDSESCIGRHWVVLTTMDHLNYLGIRHSCSTESGPHKELPDDDPRADAIEAERIREVEAVETEVRRRSMDLW